MAMGIKLTTAQVGKCGELLVQYELLKRGIESAPMTTDYGIDLVAIESGTHRSVTIQVKASQRHEDATSEWVEWNMRKECVADLVAVVDIDRGKVWLFTKTRFESISKSTGEKGRRLWWYIPGLRPTTATLKRSEGDFANDDIDAAVPKLF